jgi:hypothetical protein
LCGATVLGLTLAAMLVASSNIANPKKIARRKKQALYFTSPSPVVAGQSLACCIYRHLLA